MARTLNEKLAQLTHERRERIQTQASGFITEEMSRRLADLSRQLAGHSASAAESMEGSNSDGLD